ncbi:hypothetical protein JCM3770_006905 [Rhodotorula araucariae]
MIRTISAASLADTVITSSPTSSLSRTSAPEDLKPTIKRKDSPHPAKKAKVWMLCGNEADDLSRFFKQQQLHADHDIRNVNDLSDKGFEALLHRLDDEREEDNDLLHLKPREGLVTDMYNSGKAWGTLLKFQLLGKRLRYSGIVRRAWAETAKHLVFNAKHVPRAVALEQQPPKRAHIEEADFCLAEDLVAVLKPIANLTAAVSKAKAVQVGNIKYYAYTDDSKFYRLGLLLHPSLRIGYLRAMEWEDDWVKQARELAIKEFAPYKAAHHGSVVGRHLAGMHNLN